MIKQIIVIVFVLSLMFLTVAIFIDIGNDPELQNPSNRIIHRIITGEKISPADHIKEDQIIVEEDKVIVTVENVRLASFVDLNAMDPLLDETSNAIQIIPESTEQIHNGDIISYTSDEDILISRVVKIGKDESGIYYITKGDNDPLPDNKRIRFWQIRFITVGIIY
jgi:hypothetical protein